MEQPGPVAAGNLAEVVHRSQQWPCAGAVTPHGPEQAIEPALNHDGGLAHLVAEDVRSPMHPAIDPLDRRPEGGGAPEAPADQLAQPRERRRATPFSTTRSRLSATASSRALSFSPEAANGVRPSSVRALRTAAQ
jgi:hypothetical protein